MHALRLLCLETIEVIALFGTKVEGIYSVDDSMVKTMPQTSSARSQDCIKCQTPIKQNP